MPSGRHPEPYAKREDADIRPLPTRVMEHVLDVIFLALTLSLFAIVGLVVKGVERL
jgi:hypothetical protein